MLNLSEYKSYNNEKKIALIDNSTISFLEQLDKNGYSTEELFLVYDLILIPQWVVVEVSDSEYRTNYVNKLVERGLPIYAINEVDYSNLVNDEELNLYHIVVSATAKIVPIVTYLNKHVKKDDPLDMDAYEDWISMLYEKWPIGKLEELAGRNGRKNAGEISLTILAEIYSWYYPDIEYLTMYTQDRDTYLYCNTAEEKLKKVFKNKSPLKIGFKSNDAILFDMFRRGELTEEAIRELRKDERTVIYVERNEDDSVVVKEKKIETEEFMDLLKKDTINLVF